MVRNVYWSPRAVTIIFASFNETQTFEKYSNIEFHEIRPVGAKIFHADEGTEATKVTVAFRSFANAPEKG